MPYYDDAVDTEFPTDIDFGPLSEKAAALYNKLDGDNALELRQSMGAEFAPAMFELLFKEFVRVEGE